MFTIFIYSINSQFRLLNYYIHNYNSAEMGEYIIVAYDQVSNMYTVVDEHGRPDAEYDVCNESEFKAIHLLPKERLSLFLFANFCSSEESIVSREAKLIMNSIRPDVLTILISSLAVNDFYEYISNPKLSNDNFLADFEVEILCLDIHQTFYNLKLLENKFFYTDYSYKEDPLIVYISHLENLAHTMHLQVYTYRPYISFYYNSDTDTYVLIHSHVEKSRLMRKFNVNVNIDRLYAVISALSGCNAANENKFTLVTHYNLGDPDKLYVTEVLDNLLYVIKPQALILLAPPDSLDAKKYISRESTQLNYTINKYVKFAECIDDALFTNNLFVSQEVSKFVVQPTIIKAPFLSSKSTQKILSIYVTHYNKEEFNLNYIVIPDSVVKYNPYISIFFDLYSRQYKIINIATFNKKISYHSSNTMTSKQNILDVIYSMVKELHCSKTRLFSHANLGYPDSNFVSVDLDEWIHDLSPDIVELLYTEQNRHDVIHYTRFGISHFNLSLPKYEIKIYLILELVIKQYLQASPLSMSEYGKWVTNYRQYVSYIKPTNVLSIYIVDNSSMLYTEIDRIQDLSVHNNTKIIALYSAAENNFFIRDFFINGKKITFAMNKSFALDKFIGLINKVQVRLPIFLYCQSSIGHAIYTSVSPLVDKIIKSLSINKLILFTNKDNHADTVTYLRHEKTSLGLCLTLSQRFEMNFCSEYRLLGLVNDSFMSTQDLFCLWQKINLAASTRFVIEAQEVTDKSLFSMLKIGPNRLIPESNTAVKHNKFQLFFHPIFSFDPLRKKVTPVNSKISFSLYDEYKKFYKDKKIDKSLGVINCNYDLSLMRIEQLKKLICYRDCIILNNNHIFYVNYDYLFDYRSQDLLNLAPIEKTAKNKKYFLELRNIITALPSNVCVENNARASYLLNKIIPKANKHTVSAFN